MPKDRFNPREWFGFTGQPLAIPAENVPMPQQMRDRFARQGQEAFIPYISPYETLARGQQYQHANNAFQIGDAENEFMGNLESIAANPSGLSEFLQKHPAAALSPMVRTWAKMTQPPKVAKDPYESHVATLGSEYLKSYRDAKEAGKDASEAFSLVQDAANKAKEAAKAHKDEEFNFVKMGGDLEDFPALKAAGASPAAQLQHIRDKGKPPSTFDVKQHSKLSDELRQVEQRLETPDTEDSHPMADAFETVKSKKPETPEEWNEAYSIYKDKLLTPKQKALEEFEAGLADQGKRIPGQKAPITSPAAIPAPTTSQFDGGPVAAPVVPPAVIPTVKPKPGLSPLSQVRQALKP